MKAFIEVACDPETREPYPDIMETIEMYFNIIDYDVAPPMGRVPLKRLYVESDRITEEMQDRLIDVIISQVVPGVCAIHEIKVI